MGSSRFDDSAVTDYTSRVTSRAATGTPTFAYSADISAGRTAAKVHDSLEPFGVKVRESRDSGGQEKVPIVVMLDTTGSMGEVPGMIQKELPKLVGGFVKDKASGKKYLGDNGYPDILFGAVDDYDAQASYTKHSGTLQISQFESGLALDDHITNLWITQNGGGSNHESYELAAYFVARHTDTDHWNKRGRKGYMFIIGDEHPYAKVSKTAVKTVIGDSLEADITVQAMVAELQERWHVFYVLPNMTHNYKSSEIFNGWVSLLGKDKVIRLEDPAKIVDLIVGAVAVCEVDVALDDLESDGLLGADTKALALLAGKNVAKADLSALPAVSGGGGGIERL